MRPDVAARCRTRLMRLNHPQTAVHGSVVEDGTFHSCDHSHENEWRRIWHATSRSRADKLKAYKTSRFGLGNTRPCTVQISCRSPKDSVLAVPGIGELPREVFCSESRPALLVSWRPSLEVREQHRQIIAGSLWWRGTGSPLFSQIRSSYIRV